MLHLLKGDWAQARSRIEGLVAVARTGNLILHLPRAVASSAWALAQLGETSEALNRLREGEQLLERQAASGIAFHRAWGYHALGRAGLGLHGLDEAQRLGYRGVETSQGYPGIAAHALDLLRDSAIASMPRAARPTTARRSRSPSPAACAHWLPIATLALVSCMTA